MSERYINKKCQNCGSLRGVDHANECDCCGGDVWVFVCSKHQLFSLTTSSCPLCETEFSYSSQEKKWISTQQLIKSSKPPYKTFLVFGIIIGSILMYYVRNLELYESKQVDVKRQLLETQTGQLSVLKTEIEVSNELLTISNYNVDELERENKKLNINLDKHQQSASADEALINSEILQLNREIKKYTDENRELFKSVATLRNSTVARPSNSQRQQNIDTKRYYKYNELDIKPIAVVKVKPINPKRGLFGSTSGSTKVKLLIDQNGEIINTQLISSTHKKFTNATFEALKQWEFSPGGIRGQNVKVEMELDFTFGSDD